MSIEMVFFMSVIIFIVSLLGLFLSSDAISSFIAHQIMAAAAVVNFLNFSLRINPQDPDIRILLILGLVSFYLLEFAVIFYIYSNIDSLERKALIKDYRLLSLEKSDWWGEDRI